MSFRVCATVLLLDAVHACQSYEFKRQRILGSIKEVLKSLERYEVDEIHSIIPIKGEYDIDVSAIFRAISQISISTPISIGGGISAENMTELLENPFFERLIFNRALFHDDGVIEQASSLMGQQAVIGSLPFVFEQGCARFYNAASDAFVEVSTDFWQQLEHSVNEVLLLDAAAEGTREGFDFAILDACHFPIERVLISGGICPEDIERSRELGLAGVSIDNTVLHREYSIKELV